MLTDDDCLSLLSAQPFLLLSSIRSRHCFGQKADDLAGGGGGGGWHGKVVCHTEVTHDVFMTTHHSVC